MLQEKGHLEIPIKGKCNEVTLYIYPESSKAKLYEDVKACANLANIYFIRQKETKGLAHALLCGKSFVGNEPFAVLYGDDVIISEDPVTAQLTRCYEKYGKGVLKEMGFTSMRKLAAEVTGIVIRSNKLYIDEAFAQQTEEIEQFVRDFANGDGKRSVRALGMQLKKNFDGFDYRNYGFDRFTDFINAIDGVKADRYHVDPVKES